MVRIAVYGTLRRGMGLHDHYLSNARYLGEDEIEGFELYYNGLPWAVKGNGKLKVEVYDVDKKTYLNIKVMEEDAGYETIKVKTRYGTARMWIARSKPIGAIKIEDGDFTRFMMRACDAEF